MYVSFVATVPYEISLKWDTHEPLTPCHDIAIRLARVNMQIYFNALEKKMMIRYENTGIAFDFNIIVNTI